MVDVRDKDFLQLKRDLTHKRITTVALYREVEFHQQIAAGVGDIHIGFVDLQGARAVRVVGNGSNTWTMIARSWHRSVYGDVFRLPCDRDGLSQLIEFPCERMELLGRTAGQPVDINLTVCIYSFDWAYLKESA